MLRYVKILFQKCPHKPSYNSKSQLVYLDHKASQGLKNPGIMTFGDLGLLHNEIANLLDRNGLE